MKHRYTKERNRDRQEFVHMFRQELGELEKAPWIKQRQFTQNVIRPFLGYSPKTVPQDIWNSLMIVYKNSLAVSGQ